MKVEVDRAALVSLLEQWALDRERIDNEWTVFEPDETDRHLAELCAGLGIELTGDELTSVSRPMVEARETEERGRVWRAAQRAAERDRGEPK